MEAETKGEWEGIKGNVVFRLIQSHSKKIKIEIVN